ncbi:hypothetical protein MVEN_02000300 [Mycena venus]|uniref:Uncharacterized protein n=1 Tax=Mycena venus TaxID=2733690 RepID=A0A8H6XDB1_9AGAR|nr:hypothetical protein MVEN_02000300 [Mycena venus]
MLSTARKKARSIASRFSSPGRQSQATSDALPPDDPINIDDDDETGLSEKDKHRLKWQKKFGQSVVLLAYIGHGESAAVPIAS